MSKRKTPSQKPRAKAPARSQTYARHNWAAIRQQYIEGVQVNGDPLRYPTLDELSKTWGVDESYMRNVAGKERWLGQREAMIKALEEARRDKRIETLATHGAEWDAKCLDVARAQLAMIVKRMNALNSVTNTPDAKELHMLATALRTVQTVGKIAMGEAPNGDDDRPREIRIVRESRALPEDD